MATRYVSYRRVEPALVERRAAERRPSAPVGIFLLGDDETASVPAMLQEISPFGCRLICVAAPAAGERVRLELDGEEIEAAVVWREASLLGCRFDQPVARSLARRLTLALQ